MSFCFEPVGSPCVEGFVVASRDGDVGRLEDVGVDDAFGDGAAHVSTAYDCHFDLTHFENLFVLVDGQR